MSHDNMENHGVEKLEKREVKWPVEAGLPSPEASHRLLTDCPLLTMGKGCTDWVSL